MSQYPREPWYYKYLIRLCKTDKQKKIVGLIVRERKGILMGLLFLVMCGTFPRLLSISWNEDRYFGANRYQKRLDELKTVEMTKLDEKSEK